MKQIFFLWCILPLVAFAQYAEEYKDYSQKQEIDTAIAVVGYNRTQYFKQTIEALAQNPEAETLPIFFFLDGGGESKQKEHIALIERMQFKNYHLICQKSNYGCGRNIIDARRFLFDWCQFERVIVIEDDNVIAPNYIAFVRNLYQWAQKNYTNVGIVSGWSLCNNNRSYENKLDYLDCVHASEENLWAYLIDKKAWDAIKTILYTYEKKFLSKTYHQRNHEKIRKWAEQLVKKTKVLKNNTSPFPYTMIPAIQQRILKKSWPSGQDGITVVALYHAGYIYVTTDVNRVINIGKRGVHELPENWERKFKYTELDVFPEDNKITEFRLQSSQIKQYPIGAD